MNLKEKQIMAFLAISMLTILTSLIDMNAIYKIQRNFRQAMKENTPQLIALYQIKNIVLQMKEASTVTYPFSAKTKNSSQWVKKKSFT